MRPVRIIAATVLVAPWPARPTGPQQRRHGRLQRPCPPGGSPHHYRFTIYALQHSPDVGDDANPETTMQAIGAAATARGRLVSTYGR